jgi:hypothetical protein
MKVRREEGLGGGGAAVLGEPHRTTPEHDGSFQVMDLGLD